MAAILPRKSSIPGTAAPLSTATTAPKPLASSASSKVAVACSPLPLMRGATGTPFQAS
jgi:alpha/beta superfamily hydrolase